MNNAAPRVGGMPAPERLYHAVSEQSSEMPGREAIA